MNLEGYASDGESSDENSTVSGPIVPENKPAFVATSNAQNSTFGGVYQKVIALPKARTKRNSKAKNSKNKKRKFGDPESLDFKGSWASSDSSDYADEAESVPADSEEEKEEAHGAGENSEDQEKKVTTELYVEKEFMHLKSMNFPKKPKLTVNAHSKGVTRLRFLPKSGHLLLSCGNDGKIFLWEIESDVIRKVRGYFGHSQAVKEVVFSADGNTFLSCSYDHTVLLWDTNTGEILKTFRVSAFPNCALFNPSNKHEFVVGLENNKIVHYDLNSPDSPLQVYDHHLGAINSLTAVKDEGVFVSTSEDRTVRFWKWHINIPTKIIADATQHSIPSVAVHPREKFIALQSMDDSIHVVNSGGKNRFIKSKSFSGHKVAGYGIEIDFSCDGESLVSGDVKGNLFIWSWKTCRVTQKVKLDDLAITCVATHPSRPNVVAAAGRKGDVYLCTLRN